MKAASSTDGPVIYYRDKGFLITSAKAKSPHKTYRVDKIEKVSLRRDPFFITLAFTIFLTIAIIKFGFILSDGIYMLWLFSITLTFIAARFGMLFITSKAVSELAFFGLYPRLVDVREAIEKAMHKDDPDDGLAADDDEEDDDDE
mgnify:CR=1 FL=1